ncbi:MAG: hypothetical protein M0R66_06810 [Candidatus Omnitrophica bacterium]|jgi:hypothetical protein|nr:hypothetical protein [Candidatus Omnitrophota bacterium]
MGKQIIRRLPMRDLCERFKGEVLGTTSRRATEDFLLGVRSKDPALAAMDLRKILVAVAKLRNRWKFETLGLPIKDGRGRTLPGVRSERDAGALDERLRAFFSRPGRAPEEDALDLLRDTLREENERHLEAIMGAVRVLPGFVQGGGAALLKGAPDWTPDLIGEGK